MDLVQVVSEFVVFVSIDNAKNYLGVINLNHALYFLYNNVHILYVKWQSSE